MKTSAQKPKLIAHTGFYIASDAAYAPTIKDTDAGYFLEKEPVKIFNPYDASALTDVLRDRLSSPNEVISAPPIAPKSLVVGDLLRISTQAELERKTVFMSVTRLDTGFRIESQPKKSDGTWDRKADRLIDCYLPVTTTYEQLAAAIIEHLKSRKDLPGSMVDFNQPKTARGA